MGTTPGRAVQAEAKIPFSEQPLVREQMERILASAPFRNSKRYPVLLRYVVEQTLAGHGDSLKERTVGVEAFQREPDYDTNIDPVVRITAGEVRKRIAQYYHEEGHGDELRIDLPAGSYVPSFNRHSSGEAAKSLLMEEPTAVLSGFPAPAVIAASVEAARARKDLRWPLIATAAAAMGLALGLLWPQGLWQQSRVMRGPWKTFAGSGPPVLLSVGEPNVRFDMEDTSVPLPLTVREHLRQVDLMTFSDVQALTRLTALLERAGRSYRLQPASETTFADLRQGPSVVLGGFDNPWTLRAMKGTRFHFERTRSGLSWIEDAKEPASRQWQVDFGQPYAALTEDFAVVARFVEPETHQALMVVAGVGENGTKAAGEFATDTNALRNALGADAMENANFEVVLGTRVIHGVSGPPRVLAKEVW